MWSPTLLLGLLSAVDVLVHSKSIYTRDGVMSGSNTTALPGRFIVEFTEVIMRNNSLNTFQNS